jgi:hypothetical protein
VLRWAEVVADNSCVLLPSQLSGSADRSQGADVIDGGNQHALAGTDFPEKFESGAITVLLGAFAIAAHHATDSRPFDGTLETLQKSHNPRVGMGTSGKCLQKQHLV